MKTIFFVIASLILSFNLYSQEWNEKYGWPVVSLIETNPWLMVIGSDVPTIAIYEHGDIIYKRVEENTYKYYSLKMEEEELQELIYSLGITDSLLNMPPVIAVQYTDQPTNILTLAFDSLHACEVYGDLRIDNEARKNTPQYFLTVFDNLIKYKSPNEKEWIPEYIEVMLTDYSHSPEVPLKWSEKWPDLNAETTVKRTDMLYSIYLPKAEYNDFKNLIKSLKEKQAVEINGKLFSVSTRFPFPNFR